MNNTNVHPGTSIRPILDSEIVKKLLKDYYGLTIVEIVELNGYDDKNFYIKVEEASEDCGLEGYVFKVINALDSMKPNIFEAQTSLLIHLGRQGIPCPKPIISKNGQYLENVQLKSGQHLVRLLEFIRGTILMKIPVSPNLYYEVGETIAKLDVAMKDFSHVAYQNHNTLWMLESVTKLPEFIHVIPSDKRRKIVEEVIKDFQQKVISQSSNFKKALIHGDANEQNIIVEKTSGDWKIKAIIDFGDCHIGCYLYELAITITYMMLLTKNLDVGGYVLAGYMSVLGIPKEECSLLKVCIAARLCQSLVLGAYSASLDPSNKYVLATSHNGWDMLENLWNFPEEDLLKIWENTAQTFIGTKQTE